MFGDASVTTTTHQTRITNDITQRNITNDLFGSFWAATRLTRAYTHVSTPRMHHVTRSSLGSD